MEKRKKEETKTSIKKCKKAKKSYKKEEIPVSTEPDMVVLPGRKERILYMLIMALKAVIRFLGRSMLRARQKRLAKRMDSKE